MEKTNKGKEKRGGRKQRIRLQRKGNKTKETTDCRKKSKIKKNRDTDT